MIMQYVQNFNAHDITWSQLSYQVSLYSQYNGFLVSIHRYIDTYIHKYITSGVYDKRREGEYPTLTISCTNALCKVLTIDHQVLFCINTFRVTNDLMIGVNSFVVLCIWIANILLFM